MELQTLIELKDYADLMSDYSSKTFLYKKICSEIEKLNNQQNNKIIFLDIDGVLNVIGQGHDEFGQLFHKHFEDNLRWIIEQTGAKIVISSSWRRDGFEVMLDMWKKRGLAGEVIGITPTEVDVVERGTCEFYDDVDRGFEIQQYIDDNNVKNYCIIDDNDDMLPNQKNNLVKTANNQDHPDSIDIGYGLTRKCAEDVVKILNRKIK